MKLTMVLLASLLMIVISHEKGIASLSRADRDTLVYHFQILTRNGWIQSSVNACQSIVGKSSYNWADWDEFFWSYYHMYPSNQNLWSYIGYPMFWWFDNKVHYSLQMGQLRTYLAISDSLIRNYGPDLGAYLSSRPSDREALFVYLRGLSRLANAPESALPDSNKKLIVNKIEEWMQDFPQLYKNSQSLSPTAYPYLALIRYQLHQIVIESSALTDTRVDTLIQMFAIQNKYALLFRKHRLYVADNLKMSSSDLDYLDNIMSSIPVELTKLRYLTNKDYFFYRDQTRDDTWGFLGGVNTFSTVGGYQENSFPSDVSPCFTDGFCLVAAHEINHRIDPDYIEGMPRLKQRRQSLLNQAGLTDLQYLRSMVGGAFFQSAPQEFLASIANQWFGSSRHTLELALKRFDNHYQEPINQALFFCELYSVGSDSTRFYAVDILSNFKTETAYLRRNTAGAIDQLSIRDTVITFRVDSAGNVQACQSQRFKDMNPEQIYPIDKSRYLPEHLILRWKKIASARSYRLQIAQDSLFASTMYDDSTLVADSTLATVSSGPLYCWRVRAKNAGGTSAWSQVRSFTTIVGVPQPPTLAAPSDTAKNVQLNATLSWNVASGATVYHLQLSTTSGFGSTIVNDTTLTVTYRAVGPLSLATTYYWRTRAGNEGGWSAFSQARQFSTIRTISVNRLGGEIPKEYALSQNYPNPFNPTTTIQFALPKGSRISLKVFDLLGKEVTALVSQELGPGYFTVRWQADVPSGTYIYRLQTGDFVDTKKMVLLH